MMKHLKSKHPLVRPDMNVLDVVSNWRNTIDIFQRYDQAAGECICCNSLFESLSTIATKYKIDLDLLISDLETAAKADA